MSLERSAETPSTNWRDGGSKGRKCNSGISDSLKG